MPSFSLSMEETQMVRLSLLYVIDKIRKMHELARRVKHDDIALASLESMREHQELMADLPTIGTEGDAQLIVDAVDILIDEHNRQLQTVMQRGALQDAALFEHRLRDLYGVRRTLISGLPQRVSTTNA